MRGRIVYNTGRLVALGGGQRVEILVSGKPCHMVARRTRVRHDAFYGESIRDKKQVACWDGSTLRTSVPYDTEKTRRS
jgi:hypothetical protein